MTDETRPLEEAAGAQPATVAGQTFGRYVLVRRIGAGGCGEVFAAYDPILDRRIALKILFNDGGAGWAREARMLAKVSHPQVVTVHDAGVEDGQGYLATELIDGPNLDQWLREHRHSVSPRERLALLLPIAAALCEAHARGIVHGDVKPANILVAASGARITDFGVARAIDNEGPSEFAGTPAYMAPEQFEGRPASAASDQYALCLTLCQALGDAHALPSTTDRDGSGSDTQLPSERERSDFVRSAPTIPSAGLDRAITAALRRGLHPDPAKRFASMEALLDAMVAVPRRRRRIRRAVAMALAVSASTGAAAYASSSKPEVCTGAQAALAEVWNPGRADAVREAVALVDLPDAPSQAERVAEAIDTYADAWKAQHTEICQATSVRKEQSEATMDAQMFCMARARGHLEAAVDVFTDADEGVLRNLEPTLESLVPLEECLDRQLLMAKPKVQIPEGQEDAVEAMDDLLSRSHVQLAAGRFSAARDSAAQLLVSARELDYAPMIAEAQYQLAASMAQRRDLAEATPRGREALHLALELDHPQLALMASSLLAYISSQSGDRSAAEAYENIGLALLDRPGIANRLRANAMGDLATVVHDAGRFEEALSLYEDVLEITIEERGEDDWRVPHAIDNIAMTNMSLGNRHEAIDGFERAMAMREVARGESHPDHVLTLLYLGGLRIELGELEAARENFERGLRITQQELGPTHPWIGANTEGLARVALERGDLERAETLAAESLALFRETLGDEHAFVANSLKTVGHVECAKGAFNEAEAAFEEMTAIMKATMGPEHPLLGEGYRELALSLLGQARWSDAIGPLDAALVIEDAVGIEPVERVDLLSERGLARLQLGQHEQAAADLEAAAKILETRDLRARDLVPLFVQGRFYQARGERETAQTWFERARDVAESPAATALIDAAVGRREAPERTVTEPELAAAFASLR